MNKLITTDSGGFPFLLNDIRFLDEAYREGMASIIKTVAEECILWGCEYSENGTIASINAGAVFFDNEIFYCPSHSVDLGVNIQDDIVLQVKEYDDPSGDGNKLFADGSTHQTYKVREVKVVDLTSSTTPHMCLRARGLCSSDAIIFVDEIRKSSIHANIADTLTVGSWQTPSFINGWTGDLKFRTIGNFIELKGDLNGFSATDYIPFILPLNYRPDKRIVRAIVGSGSGIFRYYDINIDGTVLFSQYSGETYNLDEFYTIE